MLEMPFWDGAHCRQLCEGRQREKMVAFAGNNTVQETGEMMAANPDEKVGDTEQF